MVSGLASDFFAQYSSLCREICNLFIKACLIKLIHSTYESQVDRLISTDLWTCHAEGSWLEYAIFLGKYHLHDECHMPCHSLASRLADKQDLQGTRMAHSFQKAIFQGTALSAEANPKQPKDLPRWPWDPSALYYVSRKRAHPLCLRMCT